MFLQEQSDENKRRFKGEHAGSPLRYLFLFNLFLRVDYLFYPFKHAAAFCAAVFFGMVNKRRTLYPGYFRSAARAANYIPRRSLQLGRNYSVAAVLSALDCVAVGGVYLLRKLSPFSGVLHAAAAGVQQLVNNSVLQAVLFVDTLVKQNLGDFYHIAVAYFFAQPESCLCPCVDDKGYVIRCVDQISGSVLYRGSHQKYAYKKDALMPDDTYTFSGARRTLANLQRMYPEACFYSIERLSCYYLNLGGSKKTNEPKDIDNKIVYIADTFEEEERENVLLIGTGINVGSEQNCRVPKVGLQFFDGYSSTH